MDARATNHRLSEDEKRPIRAGYYQKHNKYLDDETLSKLTISERNYYKSYKEPFWKSAGETIAGLAFFVALMSSPVWISLGWDWLFGTDTSSQSSSISETEESSNCNPNYSPCIPNSSYDLDCADIGKSVRVTGTDEYRLDRDGDGAGCESY